MNNQKPQLVRGLRDVIAGQTHRCLLDEQNQRLYYWGYAIEDLAEHSTFEDVMHLILFGELPETHFVFPEPTVELMQNVWRTLRTEPNTAHPMGLLRTAMSSMGNNIDAAFKSVGIDLASLPLEAEQESALRLVQHTGYAVGLVARHIAGKRWLAPRSDYSHAENLLFVIRGSRPDEFEKHLMDVALILYTEHEFNAGSFATRVASSAHTDSFSAAVAGECVLKGLRHGGANEEAMKMMLEIGTPENVREWCDRFFETPDVRLPGFGHPVYTRGDPRVVILRPKVRELSERKGDMRWYEIGVALEEYMAERAAQKGRGIPANVDLWTAPLYYLLEIPIPMYTPIFAAARVAGWCAHYLEVRHENKEPIIRPRAEYVGPDPRVYRGNT